MTRLAQWIAVEKGVRAVGERTFTDLYHLVQKAALLSGISRTYLPKDDEGDRLPPESTLVQTKIPDVLQALSHGLTRLFDVTLTKEVGNCSAAADVVVDGQVILADVPVTYLLFLEKKLVDINTFMAKLPTLDPASVWTLDDGVYRTPPVETVRTKKIPKNWVKAEATDRHPAQVEVFYEDVIVGRWSKVDFSGAIHSTRKAELISRVDKLLTAVKFAREAANSMEVDDEHAGVAVFSYLFG